MANEMTQIWDELWDDVQKRRHALESGIRGGVSDERRLELEVGFKAAHKSFGGIRSATSASEVQPIPTQEVDHVGGQHAPPLFKGS